MSLAGRLARAGVDAAARRWPDDLAGTLREEWHAELDVLCAEGRPWRMLAFAASLAVSPAVDEPSWGDRLTALGRAATVAGGVTLLAAALSNAVRATADGLLVAAAAVMVLAGLRVRIGAGAATPLLGLAMFAFLMAGNEVAVMPFMGVADIGPAVLTWTALMLVVVRLCRVVPGRLRPLVAAAGGLLTLEAATIAGSWHAAGVLGLGPGTAPWWFPLALLPGGTAGFGAYFPDGTAAFGSLQASGPAFHASDILLGNAAAMIGPLLLGTVFVLTLVMPAAGAARPAAPPRVSIPAGAAAALAGLAACEAMRRSAGTVDATLHRMLDHSAVFGFGFAAHPAGQAVVALLTALLVVRVLEAGTPVRR